MNSPLVSVLINNYNYARFLSDAIDSALSQTYAPIEIIVVDDGSVDESKSIIASYGKSVVSILKSNGGQASAFNAGVSACNGEVLCFLDSDDYYFPTKVARVVELFRELPGTVPLMVHHPLTVLRQDGALAHGRTFGATHRGALNLALYAKKYKYLWYAAGATSGMSINRRMADRLFPLPATDVRISADEFVVRAASLVGELHCIPEELGAYRIHGSNAWYLGSRRRSPDSISVLDDYLNRKLGENGIPGRIAYWESMWCWWDLMRDGKWGELAKRMVRANVEQHDLHTAWFSVALIAGALREAVEFRWRIARHRSGSPSN